MSYGKMTAAQRQPDVKKNKFYFMVTGASILALIVSLSLAPAANAQGTTPVSLKNAQEIQKYSLEYCIQTAYANNPQIQQSGFNLKSQEYKINQAKAPLKVQSNASAQTSWQDSTTRLGGVKTSSHSSSNSANLNFSQVVYDGGKLKAGVEISEKSYSIAQTNHKKLLLDTGLKVAENYYNAIIYQKLAGVAYEVYVSAKMHEALADENFKVGVSPKTDLIRSQANTYDKNYSFITAANTYKRGLLSLQLAMGRIDEKQFGLYDNLETDSLGVDLESSIVRAITARNEVSAQLDAIESLKVQRRQAKAEKSPQFSVSTSAGVSADNGSGSDRNSYSVMGTFSIPVINGKLTENKVADIDQRLLAEEKNLENIKLNITFEVTQAYLNLQEAYEKIEVAKKNVEAAVLSNKLTEEQYKVGLATMIDLLDSEISYSSAKSNLIQAQGALIIAKCRFKRSLNDEGFYK